MEVVLRVASLFYLNVLTELHNFEERNYLFQRMLIRIVNSWYV